MRIARHARVVCAVRLSRNRELIVRFGRRRSGSVRCLRCVPARPDEDQQPLPRTPPKRDLVKVDPAQTRMG